MEQEEENEARAAAADQESPAADGAAGGDEAAQPKKRKPRVIPLELQRLFARLQLLNQRSLSTEELTRRGFKWEGNEAGVQHDVAELNRKLYDRVEKSLAKIPEGENIIGDMYQLETAYDMVCQECHVGRRNAERGFDLLLRAMQQPDIVSSLSAGVSSERMVGDNRVFCETCGEKRDTLRGRTLTKLPNILVCTLTRFSFDFQTLSRVKVTERCEFPLVLDMRPFKEGGSVDAANAALAQAAYEAERAAGDDQQANERLREAEVVREQAEADARRHCAWISALDTKEGRRRSAELSHELWQLPKEDLRYVYDLFAVVIHSGSAFSGHYYAYIRDMFGEGFWAAPAKPIRLDGKGPGRQFRGADSAPAATEQREEPKSSAAAKRSTRLSPLEKIRLKAIADEASPLRLLRETLRRSPLHEASKLHFCRVDELGSAFQKTAGASWSRRYKKQWGSLIEFARAMVDDFLVDEADNVVYLLAKEKDEEKEEEKETTSKTAQGESSAGDGEKEDDDEWQVAGKKNRSKPKEDMAGSNAQASPAAAADEADAKRIAEEEAQKAKLRAMQQVHRDLTATFGRWFAFDDSNVYPITVTDIAQSFAGSSSAYMLMYRSRGLPERPEAPSQGSDEATNVSIPMPPPYWLRRVEEENAALDAHRDAYERKVNQMSLFVHTPSMYKKEGLRLQRADVPDEAAASADGTAVREGANAGGIRLTVDLRDSVQTLKERVATVLAERGAEQGVPQDAADLALHMVRPLGDGFHLYEGLPDETTKATLRRQCEGDVGEAALNEMVHATPLKSFTHFLSQDCTLLAWDGQHVGDDVVFPGLEGEPLRLHITYLDDRPGGGPPVRTTFPIELPRSGSFDDLREAVADLLGSVTPAQLVMHRKAPGRQDRVRVVRLIPHRAGSADVARLEELDLTDGVEVFVETELTANGRRRQRPLAQQEATRREAMREAVVVWRAGGVPAGVDQRALQYPEVTDVVLEHRQQSGESSPGVVEARVTLEVQRTSTVQFLKELAARVLEVNVEKCDGAGRCRRGNTGPLIDDESDTLPEAGISSSDHSLVVEPGNPLSTGDVSFHVALVTGNSTAPEGGRGKRSRAFELIVPRSQSLADLKARVLQQAVSIDLPLGETGLDESRKEDGSLDCSVLARHRRFRNTNFMGEEEKLVDGENRSVGKAFGSVPSLLLLEEGALPIKGRVVFQSSLWVPEYASSVLRQVPDGILPGASGDSMAGGDEEDSTAHPGPAKLARVQSSNRSRVANAMDYMLRVRAACLWPLPEVAMDEKSTLKAVKQALLQSPILCAARLRAKEPNMTYDPKAAKFDPPPSAAAVPASATEGKVDEEQKEAGAGQEAKQEANGTTGSDPVADVEESVTRLGAEARTLEDEGVTWQHLRIRELGSNRVPGKVLRPDGKMLKSLHVNSRRRYVVEVLEEPEEATDADWFLWVQRRIPNPDTFADRQEAADDGGKKGKKGNRSNVFFPRREDSTAELAALAASAEMAPGGIRARCGQNFPVWPPYCVRMSAGPTPTFTQLCDAVTSSLGHLGIHAQEARFAKFFPHKKVWGAIQPESTGGTSNGGGGKSGGGKGRKKKKGGGKGSNKNPPSLKNPPLSLRDGDLVAVSRISEDPQGLDDWMRVEDYAAALWEERIRAEVRAEKRAARWRGSGARGRGGGESRPEATLNLGSSDDYEFGDEESDGGESVDDEPVASAPPAARQRSDSAMARELQAQLDREG